MLTTSLLLLAAILGQSPRPLDVTLAGLDGKSHRLLPTSSPRGVVAFFILAECPIANAYAPEMARISRKFAPKGWRFYAVHVDPLFSRAALERHHREYGYPFPAVIDSGHAFVRAAGATKSPEAAVFSCGGDLLYRGRIDDRYVALSRKRTQPTRRDLEQALDALTRGKAVATRLTEAIGCLIPID